MSQLFFEAQDFLMNTNVEQKIFGNSVDVIYEASIRELHRLENIMSFYREASEVSLLNRCAGVDSVKLSEEMMLVLRQAKSIALHSEGAFNILLAPLIQLWKTSSEKNELPTLGAIKEISILCDNENLVLDNSEGTAYLTHTGCMIDLGGIGKGFAADVCCELYREMGATSAFINLGGNVKTIGNHPDKKEWAVGIQHPGKPRGNCYGAVMCSDLSIVTSGAYERYYEIKKTKYHHIIDSQTGFPSKSDLKSVTVISRNSMQADALSTAAFVMGLEKGTDLIYNSNCLGAIFFTASNEIYLTKGIKQYLRLFERLACYEI